MAGIQFIGTNPALDQFNAQVQRGDQARRQEDQDFRQRFALERQVGTDRGMREQLRNYYSRQTGAAPTVVAPSVAGPSVPLQSVQAIPNSAGDIPKPSGGYRNPGTGAETFPVGVSAPAISSFTARPDTFAGTQGVPIAPNSYDEPRLPNADAILAQQSSSSPPQAQATPVALPMARPQATPSDSGFRDLMVGMSNVPGAGSTMLNLYSSERQGNKAAAIEERKMHMEGVKMWVEASHRGDLGTMNAISKQYDLGIPEEAMKDRRLAAALATGTNLAEKWVGKDPERAIVFGLGFTQALASGAGENAALQAGLQAAQKAQPSKSFQPKHWYTATDNTVQAVGEDMVSRPVSGPRARPPQPPFALTDTGQGQHDQVLRDRAINAAKDMHGKMWTVLSPSEKEAEIESQYQFLRSGKRPASSAQPQSAATGLPAGATQIGTSGGKPVYEWTDAQGKKHRGVAE